jgi:hypothetical protein
VLALTKDASVDLINNYHKISKDYSPFTTIALTVSLQLFKISKEDITGWRSWTLYVPLLHWWTQRYYTSPSATLLGKFTASLPSHVQIGLLYNHNQYALPLLSHISVHPNRYQCVQYKQQKDSDVIDIVGEGDDGHLKVASLTDTNKFPQLFKLCFLQEFDVALVWDQINLSVSPHTQKEFAQKALKELNDYHAHYSQAVSHMIDKVCPGASKARWAIGTTGLAAVAALAWRNKHRLGY